FLAALDFSRTAAAPGLLWMVILAIAASAVSLYYYLEVLKQAFVVDDGATTPIRKAPIQMAAILILAASVVIFGCFPNLLVGPLQHALSVKAGQEPASTSITVPSTVAALK
ncbi:MAG TPA: hypothetical protein VGR78_14370, partial [Verrucomicrobiae bacterium]|nr:hypothetical protein [Verrucomicrobiae bacterium]